MSFPIELVFHDLTALPSTKDAVRQRIEELGRYHDRIVRARVVVGRPHRRHVKGNPYHVTVYLSVPGEDIVVSHEPQAAEGLKRTRATRTRKSGELHPEDKQLDLAVHAVFDRARRRLEDRSRRLRQREPLIEEPNRGSVLRLFPDEGYGFIEAADGREVYFHENSVLDGKFDGLSAGTAVSFLEDAGEKGPQASSVRVIG